MNDPQSTADFVAAARAGDSDAGDGAQCRDHRADERHVSAVLASLQRGGHGPATSLARREERDRLADAVDSRRSCNS